MWGAGGGGRGAKRRIHCGYSGLRGSGDAAIGTGQRVGTRSRGGYWSEVDTPMSELDSMNIYQEILAWSSKRPAWQRDALRRIVVDGGLGPSDVQDLCHLCKLPYGLVTETLSVVPVTAGDLPTSGSSTGTGVSLTRIYGAANVNALLPGQEICFEEHGLTVVYGDNGAGKSGYARIVKQLCRSRGSSGDIVSNIYATGPVGPASASLDYLSDGIRATALWAKDAVRPAQLARISVFDSFSASVYVAKDTDVPYLPAGLDLLEKLAQACVGVQALLNDEVGALFQCLQQVRRLVIS